MAATTAAQPSDKAAATAADADLQQLLTVVRQRYPTAAADPATAASDAAAPAASSSAPSAAVPAPASAESVSVAAAAAVAAAADTSDSFAAAADSVKVDKMAILMSLFKSRGMEPPPLPLFDGPPPPALGVEQLEDSKQQRQQSATAVAKPVTKAAAPSAVAVAEPASVPVDLSANATPPSAAASTTSAEIVQLTAFFDHARSKICKLCRLYQSGVLKGAGSSQALDKLSGLMRTYWAFIQQAKSHKHIDAMSGDIAADVRCTSLQQLSDRLYAQAKE